MPTGSKAECTEGRASHIANSLLTPTQVTRKSLQILHQKLNFIGKINRQYDSSFAQDGAKIGQNLTIRLPNKYTVGTGATVTPQDTVETNVVLPVATQKHVPMQFISSELTLSMDDFADRVIEPAMNVLAAAVEADAFQMLLDVYYQVGTVGTAPSALLTYLQANARLTNSLAPTSNRCTHLTPADMVVIVDALKGLFQSSTEIGSQYREGIMGTAAGSEWYQNTLMPRMTTGNKVASVVVSGAAQTGSSLLVGGVAAADTFKKGQVFTIAGVNEVHPETKVDMGRLQQFVVTADVTSAGTTVTLQIAPSITVTGAYQTVSASPANSAALVFMGAASTQHGMDVEFYKNAFAIAFADLQMPKGVDFAHREEMDGISLRVARQWQVTTDNFITRADVLYGYKTIRPELACRIASN